MLNRPSRKNDRIRYAAASFLAVGLLGYFGPLVKAQSKPRVVVTTALLCDVTKQIAQDTLDIKCLLSAGSDPHIYQSTPDDRRSIDAAQLVLYSGYDFEPALIKLIKATSNPAPKVAVDELAVPKPQTFEEDGKIETDPHVFHNAENGVAIVRVVGDSLSKIQPEQSSLYTANATKLANEFSQIHRWIKTQISTIPVNQRKLVTTHDAFGYYSTAYGIPVLGALQGISTEEKPTAKRIVELVKLVKSSGVPTIFVEMTTNPKLIEAIARESKVKVSGQELFADGIGESGSVAESYTKMLISNTKTIVEGLDGKYTEFRLEPSTSTIAPKSTSALVMPASR